MSSAPHYRPIEVRDYLLGELKAKRKHEFVDGFVYAMAGGTVTHNRIASHAIGLLFSQLREHRCEVFNSDMKIRVRHNLSTRFYYPDASVVCTPNLPTDSFHDAPVVIIEVVSESTRRVDEYEKREAYLSIDSLRCYMLVEQSTAAALVYRRADDGFERESHVGMDAIIPLPEIECQIALADLYRNVDFTTLASDEDGCE